MTAPDDPQARPERIVAAVPTPFDDGLALDRDAFRALLVELEPHLDAVLVAGTTGEFIALDDGERLALFTDALEVFGPARTIGHVGAATRTGVDRLLDSATDLGLERLALLTPYYVPLDQTALLAWFAAAAGRLGGRQLYAYLFAERTGVTTEVATLGDVLALDGMAGVKVSGAEAKHLDRWVAAARPGQSCWSGLDAGLDGTLAQGGTGIISASSTAFPALYGRLREAADESGTAARREVDEQVEEAFAVTGPSLELLHAALARRTGRPWATRLPAPVATAPQLARLAQFLEAHLSQDAA
ncbi:dihydrodipicolinate synthase family protein [Microlunatus flavus]|uniref:Dihydrodipicolinate synthase/N-acetylneuraminate lyase n=1 Tax=Microlunatus flavus TaxID=1036181 RepID=A0A1H9J663_9ACTN|nr:dihydrodipicolinate synthase family protein [Microlunatus flavus]SEQ82374.1 Dihydrodipicolinate synthase/N-acetylneuraminate lyase [Microlunatus flavus]